MKIIHESQKKILDYLKSNPVATFRDVADALDISSTSVVNYHIKELIAGGRLKKINKWKVI